MSTVDEWDFTVPDDDGELLDELRRHGVRPGQRVRVSVVSNDAARSTVRTGRARRRLGFAGSVHSEPDLSEETERYLQGFGLN